MVTVTKIIFHAIIIAVFQSDGTRFCKFNCKILSANGEAAGHPWLLFLARKNIIFC